MSNEQKITREDAMRMMWPVDADPRDYPGTYEGTAALGDLTDEQRKAAGRAEDFREQIKKSR